MSVHVHCLIRSRKSLSDQPAATVLCEPTKWWASISFLQTSVATGQNGEKLEEILVNAEKLGVILMETTTTIELISGAGLEKRTKGKPMFTTLFGLADSFATGKVSESEAKVQIKNTIQGFIK